MSTTHTFLARRDSLRDVSAVFLADYGRWHRPDLANWMALTKTRVFNPFFLLRSVFKPFWAVSILIAWHYCWRQLLFGRKYSLWIPQPTLATHMVAGMEAPGVDWAALFRNASQNS